MWLGFENKYHGATLYNTHTAHTGIAAVWGYSKRHYWCEFHGKFHPSYLPVVCCRLVSGLGESATAAKLLEEKAHKTGAKKKGLLQKGGAWKVGHSTQYLATHADGDVLKLRIQVSSPHRGNCEQGRRSMGDDCYLCKHALAAAVCSCMIGS